MDVVVPLFAMGENGCIEGTLLLGVRIGLGPSWLRDGARGVNPGDDPIEGAGLTRERGVATILGVEGADGRRRRFEPNSIVDFIKFCLTNSGNIYKKITIIKNQRITDIISPGLLSSPSIFAVLMHKKT